MYYQIILTIGHKRWEKFCPRPRVSGHRHPADIAYVENFENPKKKDRKNFAPAPGFRVTDTRPTSPDIADVENFENPKKKDRKNFAPAPGFWVARRLFPDLFFSKSFFSKSFFF